MKKGGQYQIIIGNDVGNVFNELNKLGNFSNEVKEVPAKSNEKKNIFTMLMDTISGIMAPFVFFTASSSTMDSSYNVKRSLVIQCTRLMTLSFPPTL